MTYTTFAVIGGDTSINTAMKELGFSVSTTKEADIVMLPGGADIHPAIYGKQRISKTHFTSYRDRYELEALLNTRKDAIRVGICRGAQLLHALNGGVLYQDVNNHHGRHQVLYIDEGKEKFFWEVNSIHHQMMRPVPDSHVWAVARKSTVRYLDSEEPIAVSDGDPPDAEIIWYPKTRSLCFQAHPEYDEGSTRSLFNICLTRAIKEVTQKEAA